MDLMTIAILLLTSVVTVIIGYILFKKLFPNVHYEIDIAKAFDIGDFDKIITMTEGQEFKSHSVNVYLYSARARVHQKMYIEAILWFESALKTIPMTSVDDRVFIELELADVYTNLNQLDQAEVHCRTAQQLNEKHPIANYKLAQIHYTNHKYEACRALLRPLLKENPYLADARRLYAECLACMGNYGKAIRQYGILARADEKIVSYNYARTLKALKIWERAYETYSLLIDSNIEPKYQEEMICDFAEMAVTMKRFHQGLGIIEKYLSTLKSPEERLRLRYIRASLFDKRGDKMVALKEFQLLHQERASYKDLKDIAEKAKYWLNFPFLFSYFTSNESIFEQVIHGLAPQGATILRRTPEYYLVQYEDTAFVFYRDMIPMPSRLNFDINILASQLCPDIAFLQTWSLNGIDGHYSLTGADYRFILRKGDDFLVNVKEVVHNLGYTEQYAPAQFVSGVPDAPEIIPITNNENIDDLLKSHNLDGDLEDDILERAF